MIQVKSEALRRVLKTGRVIAEISGTKDGPVFIFTAGLHGNEPTGVFALKDVFDEINSSGLPFNGKAIALLGNMKALQKNKRYIREDLNRMWTSENIKLVKNGFQPDSDTHPELIEMFELYQFVDLHFTNVSDQGFFIDLHTTSAPTPPFIALSNLNSNLDFAQYFLLPTISNIDKYLNSPMLAYANHTGDKHISMAFEAGQHQHNEAFENHKNFIRLSLYYGGCLKNNESFNPVPFTKRLFNSPELKGEYEIIFHYAIKPGERFIMKPGFKNFQAIEKGDLLATTNEQKITSPEKGLIFMPLYQKMGSDGFFIIRKKN